MSAGAKTQHTPEETQRFNMRLVEEALKTEQSHTRNERWTVQKRGHEEMSREIEVPS